MSLTVSRGLTDAGRWTAVATTLAEYLDALDRAAKHKLESPPPPRGAIAAATQFFRFVLEGIELDQKPSQRRRPASANPRKNGTSHVSHTGDNGASRPSPAMAGISNLSIAVSVMRSPKGAAQAEDLEEIQTRINTLLRTVEHLEDRPPSLSQKNRRSLAKFLRELQRQGEIERDAAFASEERPRFFFASTD